MKSISDIVTVSFYIMFLSGIVLLESNNIRVLVKRRRLRHRLVKGEQEGELSGRCAALLSGALGKNIDGSWLIAFELIVFISTMMISVRSFTVPVSVLISFIISSFPLLLLYFRLKSLQERGSKEAISLITEFYRQYRINDLNVFTAMEKTIESPGDFPVCKRQFSLLLIRLRDAAGRKSVREYCRRFAFAIGSTWGKMLASCIEIAAVSGTDISAALADMTEQIKLNKTQIEERKRLNGEAMRMTLFLVPVLYAGTVFASVKYLDISLHKYVQNQFFTREGLIFFIVSVFLFFINILLLSMVNNGKGDY